MEAKFLRSIHEVDAGQWNRLGAGDYPFVRHEFLAALEDSGSVGGDSGWQPHHLLLTEGGKPLAALPLYIKHHSYGEYVFDWAWADAYRRCGLAYYPKLVCAIPFTPCTGPRLLFGTQSPDATTARLSAELTRQARELEASSWHCLFPSAAVSQSLAERGYCQRLACQFHWLNRDYRDYRDFSDGLTSRKRKNLRKERQRVQAQGFEFAVKEGGELTDEDWDFFYPLYQITYLKRSMSTGYLTREFFYRVGQTMPEHIVMIVARLQGQPVAASLFFKDSQTLYGRYWGCRAEYDFLHFETCYYRGIDYAIARGLQRFDGGAQGEHKLQRGFEPVITYSNHWIAHPQLRCAVEQFVTAEAADVRAYYRAAQRHLPFKLVQQE